ncbi:MAG TPA: phytanoyl-CoA dioxygenase family protein [Chthonomonadaceae bacterium]|nr:phytanoyl-CoA dioxygenase family protein [Chthonomonadaceae bacterium]
MLTQEQIAFFHANGYLIMRGVFQGEELRCLIEAVDAVQAEGEARRGKGHLYTPGPDGKDVYWRSEQMWARGDVFQAVTVKPALMENIGQCIGQAFYPWNDSLVVKIARQGAAVRWHQDPPYSDPRRHTTFPIPNFTTDIYLDHSGPDNGCVWAIPGRHLVGHVDLADLSAEDLFTHYGAQPIEMEAGDVLFHALSTPHGSQPNLSDRQRRIFYIHYLAEEAYQDAYAHTGEEWVKSKPGWGAERESLVRGMIAARERLGWDSYTETGTLHLGEGGFTFLGEPVSPPAYWGHLTASLPSAERARLKTLEPKPLSSV